MGPALFEVWDFDVAYANVLAYLLKQQSSLNWHYLIDSRSRKHFILPGCAHYWPAWSNVNVDDKFNTLEE